MARYIDADVLIEKMTLGEYIFAETPFQKGVNANTEFWISEIKYMSTADVVPKSEVEKWFRECEVLQGRLFELDKEVAREIFEEIEKVLNRKIARSKPHFEKLKNCDGDFLSKWGYENMGYFRGIISTCEDLQDLIAVLKEKYTENERNVNYGK